MATGHSKLPRRASVSQYQDRRLVVSCRGGRGAGADPGRARLHTPAGYSLDPRRRRNLRERNDARHADPGSVSRGRRASGAVVARPGECEDGGRCADCGIDWCAGDESRCAWLWTVDHQRRAKRLLSNALSSRTDCSADPRVRDSGAGRPIWPAGRQRRLVAERISATGSIARSARGGPDRCQSQAGRPRARAVGANLRPV